MPDSSVHKALKFIDSIQLPERFSELERAETVPFDFDAARNQAAIVGSEIVSFVRGVTAERRRDVVNATLLAQLAADKQVGDPTNLFAWYDAYFDVLTNTGWVVQTSSLLIMQKRARICTLMRQYSASRHRSWGLAPPLGK